MTRSDSRGTSEFSAASNWIIDWQNVLAAKMFVQSRRDPMPFATVFPCSAMPPAINADFRMLFYSAAVNSGLMTSTRKFRRVRMLAPRLVKQTVIFLTNEFIFKVLPTRYLIRQELSKSCSLDLGLHPLQKSDHFFRSVKSNMRSSETEELFHLDPWIVAFPPLLSNESEI
jgi:hypothetical protein